MVTKCNRPVTNCNQNDKRKTLLFAVRYDTMYSRDMALSDIAVQLRKHRNITRVKPKRRTKIMARKPMVTRTIKSTVCTVMVVDTERAEIMNMDVTLPRTYKDAKSMDKALAEVDFGCGIKPVQIVDSHEQEQRYAMSETDFIKYATPISDEADEDETIGDAE